MKKLLLSFLVTTVFTGVAFAQQMVENFDYAAGQLTSAGTGANVSGGNWTNFSGTGNYCPVEAGSLTYTGYAGSGVGNKLKMVYSTASSEDAQRLIGAGISTTAYFSFLINVTDTLGLGPNTGTGDYFLSFRNSAGTNTGYKGLVYIKRGTPLANTFQLGVRISSASTGTAAAFATPEYVPGTTYLVVVKYTFVTGAGNDIITMYVNPDPTAAEPVTASATCTANTNDTEPDDVDGVAFRQNNSSGVGTPNCFLDGIRVGIRWQEAPMPVKVQSFSAIGLKNQVNLNWLTTNEIGMNNYVVERSTDGTNFSAVGVKAALGATSANYQFTDNNVAGVTTLYYRLKSVNTDGRFEYSAVQKVTVRDIKYSISPNPASSELFINSSGLITSAELFDVFGKKYYTKQNNNSSSLRISVANLPAGNYIVKTITDGVVSTSKIVVNH